MADLTLLGPGQLQVGHWAGKAPQILANQHYYNFQVHNLPWPIEILTLTNKLWETSYDVLPAGLLSNSVISCSYEHCQKL